MPRVPFKAALGLQAFQVGGEDDPFGFTAPTNPEVLRRSRPLEAPPNAALGHTPSLEDLLAMLAGEGEQGFGGGRRRSSRRSRRNHAMAPNQRPSAWLGVETLCAY